MKRILVAALAPVAVTACLCSDFADSVEGSWLLESGALEGEEIPLRASHPVTMILEDGRISETAACNGYRGRYRISGSGFEIPEGLAVTEMACSPAEVMETERLYLDALLATDRVAVEESGLILTGAGVELVFVPNV
jgi:heat shock protein HslJ